eukprot:4280094-Alexandrium_andersonii.AAC.1
MKCRICNSEDHFARNCPQGKGGGKGSGAPPPAFHVDVSGGSQADRNEPTWHGFVHDTAAPGPLDSVLEQFTSTGDSAPPRFMVGAVEEMPGEDDGDVPPPPAADPLWGPSDPRH